METLQELVNQRRGYKYLNKDRTSPYQNFKYDLRKKIFKADLNTDKKSDCGEGINLATLKWILNDTSILDKVIVEFSIPPEAQIIVPTNSIGKFRTDIVHRKKIHSPMDLFPEIKGLLKRLQKYKPINPITATKMPDKKRLLAILKRVRDQVRAQVYTISYFAVKEFLNLDYEHPGFDLIRMGVIVVKINKKFKVFGKNGKHLGNID